MNPRLRKHLLSTLHTADPFAMPLRMVCEDAAPVWLQSEVEAELRMMVADKLAVEARNALGEVSCKITANGKAAAIELGV